MSRYQNRFWRDLREIHGDDVVIDAEPGPVRWGRPRQMSLHEALLRSAIGMIGLFWVIVLSVAAVGMVTVGWFFLEALFSASPNPWS